MAEHTVEKRPEQQPAHETAAQETREPSRYLIPPVDIYETKDGLVVIADLPGVRKEDLDIRVDHNLLTIQGRPEPEADRGGAVINEFTFLDFFRQFTLPEQIDASKIEADLKNGVLSLKLPKSERAKPKKINVSSS